VKKVFFLLIIMVAITGGCNNKNLSNENVGDYDNQNSPELLKFGSQTPAKDDHGLDRDELTDQNPNFLNLNTDNETHVNNIGIEIQKARDVIGANNQFKVGPISTSGNNLHVIVYSDRNLTSKQERQARNQLERELTAALPTYYIEVQIKNR
jgi:hypothetical protein